MGRVHALQFQTRLPVPLGRVHSIIGTEAVPLFFDFHHVCSTQQLPEPGNGLALYFSNHWRSLR
jgi:hypothetical protein